MLCMLNQTESEKLNQTHQTESIDVQSNILRLACTPVCTSCKDIALL